MSTFRYVPEEPLNKLLETLLKVIRSYTFRATPPANSTKSVDFVYVPIRSFAAVVNFMLGAEREAWLWNPNCEALAGRALAGRAGWLAGLAGWSDPGGLS